MATAMPSRMSRTATLAAVGAAVLAQAAPVLGATRHASPTSADAVGSCSSLAPCRLDHAVNGAVAGDEIIVAPGSYVTGVGMAAGGPIFIHGVPGQARPVIAGAPELTADVLSLAHGGVARHLRVEGNAPLHSALSVERGLVEAVEVLATAGDGIDSKGASVVRDSVTRATGTGTPLQAKDGTGGVPKILNVTAVAADGDGLKVKTATATTVRSSVISGAVKVYPGSIAQADHSNLTAPFSARFTDGGSNQATDPAFTNAAAGDLRPTAASPLIDSGAAADEHLGSGDADRNVRVAGSGPDIGAFEHGAGPLDPVADLLPPPGWITLTGDREPDAGGGTTGLPPVAPPVAGRLMNVAPASGVVKVRLRGTRRFVELPAGASVPVGSTLDTTNGAVTLTTARDEDGTPQTGRFWGGRFRVAQASTGTPYANLVLAGGLPGCRTAGARDKLTTAGSRRRVRRLWGRDHGGRFRSRGRRGHATVRGTAWLTEDRCGGTLYRVKSGSIVVRAGKRKHVLRAGQRVFIR